METNAQVPPGGSGTAHWPRPSRWPSVARAGKALKLAVAMAGVGAELAPLGDNARLPAELLVRVRAARDCGA
jgi:hypothetical protein